MSQKRISIEIDTNLMAEAKICGNNSDSAFKVDGARFAINDIDHKK